MAGIARIASLGLALAAGIACRGAPPPATTQAASPVVARLGDLAVTVADLDARILALRAADRPQPGANLDEWYEQQIRALLVERLLAQEASASRLDESEPFVAARHEAERTIAVQLCVAHARPDVEQVTEAALHAAYEARATQLSAPERRATRHLFRRARGEGASSARAEVDALRGRVLAGESFRLLAAGHSDSESRHQQGSLGWVTRGQLPAGFEKVIFGLEEGVPSQPIATRDGVHLFYVEQILPARRFGFEEARAALRATLASERREAALAEIEAGVKTPAESVVLGQQELAAIARAGDPGAIVLRVGETEVTLRDLQRRTLQAREGEGLAGRPPAGQLAWRVLEQLRRRELLYHHCRSTGGIPQVDLDARMEEWRRAALPAMQRRRRMVELARRDDSRLRFYHESNAGEFSRPPRWHLRRLRVPLRDDARTVIARLEEAAGRSDRGLDRLRAEWGGEIDDLGERSLAEIRALEPKLPALIAPLRAGQLSPPYRTEKALAMVEVLDRKDAQVQPYEEVRDRVAAAYVEQYSQEMYRELADQLLGEGRLQILPEGLAAVRRAGLAPLDASVEQIEELLDDL